MPTVNAQFTANPMAFLQNNAVRVKITDSWFVPRNMTCTLRLSSSDTCSKQTGQGIAIYDLVEARAERDAFKAYYLPYSPGNSFQMQVGDQADFMFTAPMTGCSFAVGGGATPKVSHLNYQRAEGGIMRIDQDRIDQEIDAMFVGDTVRVLSKDQYKLGTDSFGGEGTEIMTFGLRRAGMWRFFYHKLQIDPGATNLNTWQLVHPHVRIA